MFKVLFEKYRIFIGVFLLLILPVVFIFFFVKEKSVAVSAEKPLEEEESEKFFVDISGQVASPGVYEIEDGKIVWDLIELAGGFNDKVDLEFVAKNINLSRKLVVEDKIYIPQVGEYAGGSDGGGGQSEKVNLNTASLEELDTLSGIGPSTAQKIIDSRPYKSVEDLKNVPGIGDSRFEELKDKVTV